MKTPMQDYSSKTTHNDGHIMFDDENIIYTRRTRVKFLRDFVSQVDKLETIPA